VKPQVSVLMPVFNTASYLSDALTSVLTQTLADIELIAVDDGSQDGSTETLKSFAARDSRVRLIIRENRGIIATRNELLAAARADFVAWMDSDDVSLPNRIAAQIEAFQDDPSLVCVGAATQCIDPDGNFLNVERYPTSHLEILAEQERGTGVRFATTMMRREVAMRVGGFREPFRIGEDLDLLLRLSENGGIANLPDILYLYRQHISSISARLGPGWIAYRDHILELAKERRQTGADRLQRGEAIQIANIMDEDSRRHHWRIYMYWANGAFANQNFPLAWRYACAALKRQPMSREAWKVAALTGVRFGMARLGKRKNAG
jgi:glycosyltransferase involved in cell wall biosynthesis